MFSSQRYCCDRSRRFFAFFCLFILCLGSAVSAQPIRPGDLDGDGRLTVIDLQRLINHLNAQRGLPAPSAALLPASLRGYADVNGDGILDQADADLLANA